MSTKLEQTWLDNGFNLDDELEDGTTPLQWIEQGFGHAAFQRWFKAGGFDPERVKELKDAGFEANEVLRVVTYDDEETLELLPYVGYSIAYMYCNGDLTLEEVAQLANKP